GQSSPMRGGLWDWDTHELQLRRLRSEKLADESGDSRQPIPRRNTTKGRKVMVEQFRNISAILSRSCATGDSHKRGQCKKQSSDNWPRMHLVGRSSRSYMMM